MSVHVEGYRNESFEALELAVLETARGRWFLEEYAKRLRAKENQSIINNLLRLEALITEQKNAFFHHPSPPALTKGNLQYFKKDEDLFEDTTLHNATPPLPELIKEPIKEPLNGARLHLQNIQQAFTAPPQHGPKSEEASPAAPAPIQQQAALPLNIETQGWQRAKPESYMSVENDSFAFSKPFTAETPPQPAKTIVIIRKNSDEVEIPMVDDEKEPAVC